MPVTVASDEDLMRIGEQYPGCQVEWVDGGILVMSPSGFDVSALEMRYGYVLSRWCEANGGRVLGSSTGFRLSNGNVRSPDVSVVLPSHPEYAGPHRGFFPGAPDFLIEIRSPSDRLDLLQQKMQEWMEMGTGLAWMIDPETRAAFVYRRDRSCTSVPYNDGSLTGEDVLPGLHVVPGELDPA